MKCELYEFVLNENMISQKYVYVSFNGMMTSA